MTKLFRSTLALALLLSAAEAAQAQAGLVNLIGLGARLGMNAAKGKKRPDAPADAAAVPTTTYQGQTFPMQRTAPELLPRKNFAAITTLETELERCHAVLLASPSAPLLTPEQRTSLQQAIVGVARAQPGWNQQAYQQEAAFYVAENARRQQAGAPTPMPTPAPAVAPAESPAPAASPR